MITARTRLRFQRGEVDEVRSSLLRYNEDLDAYELNLTEDHLRARRRLRANGMPAGWTATGNATLMITTTRRPTGDRPGHR